MKTKLLVGGLLLGSVIQFFCCTSVFFTPDKLSCDTSQQGLTTTHWKQMGGFEKYTPDSLRLGCWSTALAQLTYYHRLKPFGRVAYTSRNGYHIDERLDHFSFDFRVFTASIDSATSTRAVDQLALYSYCAALVVQKDFGTDRYMNLLAPASLLEKHFKMKVERYISWRTLVPYTLGKLEVIIQEEINNRRPVLLHFANLKDFGHAVVVDGYCYSNRKFMIHTNQGQGGPTDGWYAFDEGILRRDDVALRVVYTVKSLK